MLQNLSLYFKENKQRRKQCALKTWKQFTNLWRSWFYKFLFWRLFVTWEFVSGLPWPCFSWKEQPWCMGAASPAKALPERTHTHSHSQTTSFSSNAKSPKALFCFFLVCVFSFLQLLRYIPNNCGKKMWKRWRHWVRSDENSAKNEGNCWQLQPRPKWLCENYSTAILNPYLSKLQMTIVAWHLKSQNHRNPDRLHKKVLPLTRNDNPFDNRRGLIHLVKRSIS